MFGLDSAGNHFRSRRGVRPSWSFGSRIFRRGILPVRGRGNALSVPLSFNNPPQQVETFLRRIGRTLAQRGKRRLTHGGFLATADCRQQTLEPSANVFTTLAL